MGDWDGRGLNLAQQTVLDIGLGGGTLAILERRESIRHPFGQPKSSALNITSASVVDIKSPFMGRAPGLGKRSGWVI
jgi:hypothetical protein